MTFDFETARNYWRFAPSGLGKVDTKDLLTQNQDDFFSNWLRHFRSRLGHYWEDRHIVMHFAQLFSGKRILSFGSGIGHNEVLFLKHGAEVTCADIVPSNLKTIERVCDILNLGGASFLLMTDSSQTDFGGPYDFIYARGSLMTMPFDLQKLTMANFKRALAPNGEIILNLYTWKFVEETCGVDSPEAFARRSDPSVGDIHNPWSDWHDDRKMIDVAGHGMVITQRQFWNQALYVWYAVGRKQDFPGVNEPALVLPLDDISFGTPILSFPVDGWHHEAATITVADGIASFETDTNQFHYAAKSSLLSLGDPNSDIEMILDADLADGAFSLALLGEGETVMRWSRIVSWGGRHQHRFLIPRQQVPRRFQILISNHREKQAQSSKFSIGRLVLARPTETGIDAILKEA
jgi:SAM-dependent methyltransferase